MNDLKDLSGTDYMYFSTIEVRLRELDNRVRKMREQIGNVCESEL